jgi:tripeptidyl-peptidase-1
MSRLLAMLVVLAVCVSARHVLYNRRGTPKSFDKGGRAHASGSLHFTIALKQRNMDVLENIFHAVSNPQSAEYQNFLTPTQVMEMVAPTSQDHDAVVEWLHSFGIFQVESLGDGLVVDATVAQVEELLHTKFYKFYPQAGGSAVVRAFGEYSIPHAMVPLIQAFEGITDFPIRHYKVHRPTETKKTPDAACISSTPCAIPQSLAIIYEVPTLTPAEWPETSVGVIEFQGQNFDPTDLADFGTDIAEQLQVLPANQIINNDPTNPQIEATLDIEAVAGLNTATDPWFWLGLEEEWLLPTFKKFLANITSHGSVPQVVSVSYGWSEMDQCEINPVECTGTSQDYVTAVNNEFLKIGVTGVSILISSGDSGANGRTDPDCSLPYLKPDYPAASPFVTAVGATQMINPVCGLKNPPPICASTGYDCFSGGDEVAVSYDVASFASGGGFSMYAAQPAWQKTAVSKYLKSGVALPPASYYNSTNRAYPDVAAIGNAVLIDQGGAELVGGTSCSSPEFAAIVGVLNHYSMKATGKPLGFLNPLLYQIAANTPSAFHDITVGDNKCTEDGCSSSCQGFMCAKGWDPVTGLGTPNTATLIKAVETVLANRHKHH